MADENLLSQSRSSPDASRAHVTPPIKLAAFTNALVFRSLPFREGIFLEGVRQ